MAALDLQDLLPATPVAHQSQLARQDNTIALGAVTRASASQTTLSTQAVEGRVHTAAPGVATQGTTQVAGAVSTLDSDLQATAPPPHPPMTSPG